MYNTLVPSTQLVLHVAESTESSTEFTGTELVYRLPGTLLFTISAFLRLSRFRFTKAPQSVPQRLPRSGEISFFFSLPLVPPISFHCISTRFASLLEYFGFLDSVVQWFFRLVAILKFLVFLFVTCARIGIFWDFPN